MTWIHFGNSLCSPAVEGASSAVRCSGGAPSALSRSTPTASASSWLASATGCSQTSRSGTMCKPSTGCHGGGSWMWSAAAFPVKTSASRARERALTGSAAGSGRISRASFARWDPGTFSWRTAQLSLLAGLDESSVIWPRSGMMRGGGCLELPTLARRTSGTACGSGQSWPTPTAADGTGGPDRRQRGPGRNLRSSVAWPTPTVHGNHNAPRAGTKSGTGLSTAVKRWPTPTANDSKSASCPASPATRDSIPGELIRQNSQGPLNPAWVEWLMGWPQGWTDLESLATDRYRSWLQQHGASLALSCDHPAHI